MGGKILKWSYVKILRNNKLFKDNKLINSTSTYWSVVENIERLYMQIDTSKEDNIIHNLTIRTGLRQKSI
jgi:hypothetical protein